MKSRLQQLHRGIALILALIVMISTVSAVPNPQRKPTIDDVLEILKYLAGMSNVHENTDNPPTIDNALEILKYLAGITSMYGLSEELELRIKEDYINRTNQFRISQGIYEVLTIESVRSFHYFGTFGDCVVLRIAVGGSPMGSGEIVAGYSFGYPTTCMRIRIWKNGEFYGLQQGYLVNDSPGAYDLGFLSEKDIGKIHSLYIQWQTILYNVTD